MQGHHLVAELHGCRAPHALLREPDALRALCLDAVRDGGLHSVGDLFHRFAEGRDPGVTGVVLLAESHLAVHTWPEYGTVTLDVYVCNHQRDHRASAERLLQRLIDAFSPEHTQRQAVLRAPVQPASAGSR